MNSLSACSYWTLILKVSIAVVYFREPWSSCRFLPRLIRRLQLLVILCNVRFGTFITTTKTMTDRLSMAF